MIVLNDDDDDSEDEYGPHTQGRLKVHKIPFTDHTGRTAFMVFENLEFFSLPPLFSFALYFTHVNVTSRHTDMKCLRRELSSENEDFDFDARLDVYFLPGASNEDCISHYLGEKATRGSYRTQLQKFKECGRDEVYPLPGTNAQLPGMVNRYRELGQILFMPKACLA